MATTTGYLIYPGPIDTSVMTNNKITLNDVAYSYSKFSEFPSEITFLASIVRILAEEYPQWHGTLYVDVNYRNDVYNCIFFYKAPGVQIYDDMDEPTNNKRCLKFTIPQEITSGAGVRTSVPRFLVEAAIYQAKAEIEKMLSDEDPDKFWAQRI